METSASFEARYAPLPYPTNQVPCECRFWNEPLMIAQVRQTEF
jgi:hypothetical protein